MSGIVGTSGHKSGNINVVDYYEVELLLLAGGGGSGQGGYAGGGGGAGGILHQTNVYITPHTTYIV